MHRRLDWLGNIETIMRCRHERVAGPAVLQLRKWSDLQVELNISEFCEVFLSPTRELLLLLSYQCEALLLPLTAGKISLSTSENGVDTGRSCFEHVPLPSTSSFCSIEQTNSSIRGPTYVKPSSYEPVHYSPKVSVPHGYCSMQKQCPAIFDVKSLTWGHCGDGYDQNFFKELLVVSGRCGVFIHCFRDRDENNETIKSAPVDGLVEGKWVNWGPSAASTDNLQAREHLSFSSKGSESFSGVKPVAGTEAHCDFSDSCFTVKCWLKSFLVAIETTKSENNLMTKFPVKPSLPRSAVVVSFAVNFSTPIFSDFLSCANPVSKANKEDTAWGKVTDHSLYPCTCSHLFSNSSHSLIGFVMTLPEHVPSGDTQAASCKASKVVVVVAMVHQWGIQWLFPVCLPDYSSELGPKFEWTDFKYSENYLLCLSSLGLVLAWSSTTGKLVARLDILQCCGMNASLKFAQTHSTAYDVSDIPVDQGKEVHGKMIQLVDYYYLAKGIFKKLMVPFNCSQFAAVDEYGIVYLFCEDDFVCEENDRANKLSHFYHGYGMFTGWTVADSDIGCQAVFSDPSRPQCSNILVGGNDRLSLTGYSYDVKPLEEVRHHVQRHRVQSEIILSGGSKKPGVHVTSTDISSINIRRLLLPVYRFDRKDSIFFSSFGITRLANKCDANNQQVFKIVHTPLTMPSSVLDDGGLQSFKCSGVRCLHEQETVFPGQAIGFSFQGSFYLATQDGLFIVLPAVSISSSMLSGESFGYWQPILNSFSGNQMRNFLETTYYREQWPPWKLEVLDRTILYESPEEADRICLENGWELKIARLRCLHLALEYLKYEEIERSLEKLVDVNMAEEGILGLIFTSVYQIFCKVGNDSEVALASRFLALAASFATKMVRKYGLLELNKERFIVQCVKVSPKRFYPQETTSSITMNDINNLRRLQEMAYFLEIVRNLQQRLSTRHRKPGQQAGDGTNALSLSDVNVSQKDSPVPDVERVTPTLTDPLGVLSQRESAFPLYDMGLDGTEKLALSTIDSVVSPSDQFGSGNFNEIVVQDSMGFLQQRKFVSLENPKDMIARWKINNLDVKAVVKDALESGRLPLAVLQIHLQHLKDLDTFEKEPCDTFNEVRDVGRAIAYELFLKGETRLAIATLQRLGEDIETSLRQLVFGTVRKSLRRQIAAEMKRYGYLGPYEWKVLERISLIERLYPSSTFWGTYHSRQNQLELTPSPILLKGDRLQLTFSMPFGDYTIQCDEVDGTVIGYWINISESASFSTVKEDNIHAGYWAGAAAWSYAWDQRTMDRIVLDQPLLMGVHTLWESQLEYYVCHSDWDEVSKLLDVIPPSLLVDGSLQVNLDGLHSATSVKCGKKISDHASCFFHADELDSACINVPNVKIFRFSADSMCSMWLRMLIEKELAKKFIFMKEHWEGTAEIIWVLSRAGFIVKSPKVSSQGGSTEIPSDCSIIDETHEDTVQAFHKLVIHFCTQYNLPNFLDLYLDHHKAVLDYDSLISLQEAAADCQWAQWLLLSRIKGCEYDASFSNARSIMLHNMDYSNNLSVLEINEIIHTVDDMAEGGGEIAALATLMYAPVPIQECLCSGSVNRNYSSSAQCTLENLRPSLQQFPTLWRILVSACFGQDADICSVGFNSKRVLRKSSLSEYLNWREQIFSSTGGDTSLTQMLPCWFPNPIRRLVQIFVQGPFGWQSLSGVTHAGESFVHRDSYLDFIANDNAEVHAVSWEAAIQKNIEEELYASSMEKREYGVEHHLHRGRTLAAFNHLLSTRVGKLKSADVHREPSAGSVHGQTNIQLDVQTLLAPLSENEESVLSCVMPLAVLHYDDSALVGSCAFLLELCGLSASTLRVDIAALRRISFFYTSVDHSDQYKHLSPRGSAFHAIANEENLTLSLAQALAEDYQHSDNLKHGKCDTSRNGANRKPSRSVLAVLHHLEKASLPGLDGGNTCGSWLSSGIGDGAKFRSQQKESSQHWNLVTTFCQLHRLPLSTKYLALLAKDNDWVGFFTEAQVGSFPFDVVIQVASEFSDPRLKMHILTVLKSLQSTRKKVNSSMNPTAPGRSSESYFSMETDTVTPVELFGILTKCEKQKNAGEALLMRAKDLRWSLLAMVASCFPDVSPLSCLTVWLEITAARETSSIKVNDFSSQIANNVGAAVEATNSLTAGNRTVTFHYNRRNPKRRHLMEHNIGDMPSGTLSDSFSGSNGTRVLATQEIAAKEARKKQADEQIKVPSDPDEGLTSLSKMVAVLCEQRLFLPLLRAFEMFLPSCSLLPFIRSLQAFSQMRLSDAAAHLASFSSRVKEERYHMPLNITKDGKIGATWISSTAAKAADAMLSTCPSPYERRCLLQLLAAADFGDGGSAAACFRRLYWKINLAEPSLRKSDDSYLGNETLDDDASLLTALEKNGQWEQARNWARQLESSGAPWKSVVHHVTETQAEAMVTEWKEFLWDVPEERAALWGHCQTLFIRYAFPALQAGLFFLKHAEAVEKDVSARELHEMLLLALQWLSGTITKSSPVYPLHLLREIETRVWLLAVESEAQFKTEGDISSTSYSQNPAGGNSTSIVDQTASVIGKMDNHLSIMRARATERNENSQTHTRPLQIPDSNLLMMSGGSTKTKRRAKSSWQSRRSITDSVDRPSDFDDNSTSPIHTKNNGDLVRSLQLQEENVRIEASLSGWEERVGPAELERAVLSLLEFGQITAAKQLQQKLSPSHMPSEFAFVDAALKLAAATSPTGSGEASLPTLDQDALSLIQSDIISDSHLIDPLQALEALATKFTDGSGRGLCKRIIAVVKAANVLGLSFAEAFAKQPIELLQLLSLKAQDSLEQAKLLVQTHFMPPASIARILAESFLKGLLAAHRGGYLDSQKEEGPAPLLWRLSDFLKWAELCPSKQEIGHALMRLVITGQEIPHACEVELLILAHDFYKFSACLDGVDVLVALAATRVESYVSEGDFSCLARLVTGVSNFHPLNFIMGILIENGQLEVLLHKYSATEATTGTTEAARGFRIAVLTALKHLNPHDHDSFAMVYNHFNMKHEIALLLESQAKQSVQNWFFRYDKEQNEDLLEAMRCYIEAAEVYSSVDAGNKTRHACAQASLLSLQIRMPDLTWINLSETNARRVLVEQSRFQEALIVAEAYGLNQPSEWALVLWNQMPKPELTEQFVAEFVAVLPLHSSMLMDLAKFYRSEVAARGDQSHFSVWLSPGGLPAEWAKHLGRSFRCLLKCTGDLRLRMQLATMATGFGDVISACSRALDKMPEMAGPLILRKGHGGAYLPLWS